jgi:archaellum biogenesis ATPase FlaH
MARMLPTDYSLELTKSPAEKKIFEKIKSCPSDWIVFHSYDIPYSFEKEMYDKKLKSEIDFIVLVPNLGIAAFEVKGGKISIDDNNNWYSNKKEIANPFRQIEENIHILKNKYEKQYGEHSFPYYAHGVMFPDFPFQLDNEFSYEQWRIFDQHNMQDITLFITKFLKTSQKIFKEKGFKRRLPTEDELNDFAKKLSPKPKNIAYADWKKLIENSQTLFSEEQLQALCNTTYAHNRCLIEGYTGTGKTVIAIETAKYSLKMGERIAFFCFNTILADWLKDQLSSVLNEHSFVGSFHEFLNKRIEIAGLQNELIMPDSGKNYTDESRKISPNEMVEYPVDVVGNDDFWEEKVPRTALDALKKFPVKYDKVIIDEAQDIFVYRYFDVLEIILKGCSSEGIKKGKWCFFADPEQNIEKSKNKIPYSDAIELFLGKSLDDFSRPPPLSTNWRNSKNIYKDVLKLVNWSNHHNISGKIEEGQDVRYYQWSTRVEQKEEIERCLTNLIKNEKIERKDITLLSTYDPHRNTSPSWYDKSVLSEISEEHGITKYKKGIIDKITFSSIASFKGMENSVIILVDVNSYEDKNLLYVGMSRATTRLIVFEYEQAEKQRKKLWA